MMNIEQIKKEIFHSLKLVLPDFKGELNFIIPPNLEMGDLGIGCFDLSLNSSKKPEEIAEILSQKIKPSSVIEKVKNFGPYLNFFLKKDVWFKAILEDILLAKPGQYKEKDIKDKTILIEFSSPNTNKPQHLGHLRNNSLGMAISNILSELGANVIKTNLINDRGMHIIKAMLAWQKWGERKTPQSEGKKPDHFVGDFYVLFEKKKEEIPSLVDEAHCLLKKWEEGDPKTIKLWQIINNWAIEGIFETYKKTGVKFDKIYYESEIYELGKSIIKKALKKGAAYKREDGAIEIDLGDLGKRVLLRADKTSVYITQDIGLAYLRWQEYQPDKMIYVVASEQDHYFQSLFKILGLLDFPGAKNYYHLSYGIVFLPEGRMKSREGKVVEIDDFILEMENLAKKEISTRWPNISSDELSERALKIALAAVKFYLLYFKPSRPIIYKPKESISFEGATGPYLLYTYARARSILEKWGKEINFNDINEIDLSLLKTKEELKIMESLFFWPEAIKQSAKNYNPAYLSQALIKLAQNFNEFYHFHKVIGSEEKLEKARFLMVNAVCQILKKGLNLLGIETIEKM